MIVELAGVLINTEYRAKKVKWNWLETAVAQVFEIRAACMTKIAKFELECSPPIVTGETAGIS